MKIRGIVMKIRDMKRVSLIGEGRAACGAWAGVAAAWAALGAVPAASAFEVYTYVGTNDGDWHSSSNWEDSQQQHTGYPDDHTDDAIIPATKRVTISRPTEQQYWIEVGSIEVQESGGNRGVVTIFDAAAMRLGNDREKDSVVNGYVLFKGCVEQSNCIGTIEVNRNNTVIRSDTNKNGEVRGMRNWDRLGDNLGGAPGKITGTSNATHTLIISGSVRLAGNLLIECKLQNDAMVLVDDWRGIGWKIENEESNCGLCGTCNEDECGGDGVCDTWDLDQLVLAAPPNVEHPENYFKFGSGTWKCSGGRLSVACAIDADTTGDWILEYVCEEMDGVEHSVIEIVADDADIACHSADVTVTGGRFIIGEDFRTTGKLIYRSPTNGIRPRFEVAEGKTAAFSKACP